jgi:hypothetical protein
MQARSPRRVVMLIIVLQKWRFLKSFGRRSRFARVVEILHFRRKSLFLKMKSKKTDAKTAAKS